VLFILGVSALITPLVVHSQIIRQEVPIMIGASVLLAVMILDGGLSRWESVFLLALLVAYLVFLVRQSRASLRRSATSMPGACRAPAHGTATGRPRCC